MGPEEKGDLVNDDREDEWRRSSKSVKPSHEVEHGPFSALVGTTKREPTHTAGCSENSRCIHADKSAGLVRAKGTQAVNLA